MAQRAGEKSWEAAISRRRWWNLFLKPGFDINVFWNVSMSNPGFYDGLIDRGARGHRCLAFGADGGRLGGAAADRQFPEMFEHVTNWGGQMTGVAA